MTCKGKCCKYKSLSYNESFQDLYRDPLLAKRGSTVFKTICSSDGVLLRFVMVLLNNSGGADVREKTL